MSLNQEVQVEGLLFDFHEKLITKNYLHKCQIMLCKTPVMLSRISVTLLLFFLSRPFPAGVVLWVSMAELPVSR